MSMYHLLTAQHFYCHPKALAILNVPADISVCWGTAKLQPGYLLGQLLQALIFVASILLMSVSSSMVSASDEGGSSGGLEKTAE